MILSWQIWETEVKKFKQHPQIHIANKCQNYDSNPGNNLAFDLKSQSVSLYFLGNKNAIKPTYKTRIWWKRTRWNDKHWSLVWAS